MKRLRSISWFVLLAFGISWPVFLLPLLFGAPGTREHGAVALPAWAAGMWGPGIAALIVVALEKQRPLLALGLRRLGPKLPYLWAWLLPPALALLAGGVTLLIGAGRLDLEFSTLRQALAQAPNGPSLPVEQVVLIQVAAALTIAPFVNVLFALGEEIGWRGFLLPRLLPIGQGRALVASGVVWGAWHAPVIVQGYNYPGRPILGALMMVVFCVLVGVVFGWLYLRTRSAWAPALAHGSLNASAGLAVLFLAVPDTAIGGTLLSLAGWVALAVFIAWLLLTRRLPVRAGAGMPGEPAGAARDGDAVESPSAA